MSTNSDPLSLLNGQNIAFLEDVFEQYQEDPNSVSQEWQSYFANLSTSSAATISSSSSGGSLDAAMATKQGSVSRLISTYRAMGHKRAKIDPINEMEEQDASELELSYHGLSESDLDTVFDTGPLRAPDRLTLRDIVAILKANYCGSIGYEYGHMASASQRRWLRTRLEQPVGHDPFDNDQKVHILNRLTAAEGMERYLHTKYVGQKRFSLEGGESLIPMLDQMIQQGGADGVKEVIIGMAHRGRLNVLVNTLGKSPNTLFSEFEGKYDINELAESGDVCGGENGFNFAFSAAFEIAPETAEDVLLLLQIRVFDDDACQEAIELGFGELVSTFLLDGVLSGDDEEGLLHGIGLPVYGDLSLFHDFKKGCLGLGRCPVDLVDQDDIRENRAGVKGKSTLRHIKDGSPGNVAGHQVGGELDAA